MIGYLGFVTHARADEANRTISGWVFQGDLNTSFALGSLSNDVNPGWGGEASFGYRFPIDWELSVESGYDTYSGRTGSFYNTWNLVPLVLKVQYGFGTGIIQPYVFLGAGMAFNIKIASSNRALNDARETDFLDEFGFGLDLELVKNSIFFVQSKIETDYTSPHYASAQPLFLFPITAGFKFLLD